MCRFQIGLMFLTFRLNFEEGSSIYWTLSLSHEILQALKMSAIHQKRQERRKVKT